MSSTVASEGDRVVAAWAVGELDEGVALSAICATLDLPGVFCALVRSRTEDDVVEIEASGSTEAVRLEAVMTRLASRSGGRRVYQSSRDAAWAEAFDHASPPPRGTIWFACEPVALDVEARADSACLVLLGISEACKDDALAALPRLARSCAAILARRQAETRVAEIVHRLANMLASIRANVEYGASLLEDPAVVASVLGHVPVEERVEMIHALRNVLEATHDMHADVRKVAKIFGSRASLPPAAR